MAKKWRDSIEKQKRRSNVCDRQTDIQTESTTKTNRLLARRSGQQNTIKMLNDIICW